MVGTIALSEVLDYASMDAPNYGRCRRCGNLSRVQGRNTRCCQMLFWPVRTVRDVLEIKRNDPDYADLMDSVRHHGIGFPILIYGRSVHNGHHRIAAALDLGIEEIPWCNDSSIGWEEDWPDDSVLDCGA